MSFPVAWNNEKIGQRKKQVKQVNNKKPEWKIKDQKLDEDLIPENILLKKTMNHKVLAVILILQAFLLGHQEFLLLAVMTFAYTMHDYTGVSSSDVRVSNLRCVNIHINMMTELA